MTKKIMILAGEASGDNHGAEVVQALKERDGDLFFYGMAGPAMRKASVEPLIKTEDMAIMGFVEVIANLNTVWKSYCIIKKTFKTNRPDLIILIDYPGFNLKIAELAKKFHIKVLYYVSPQIWAWKQKRIEKIKQYVDHMAVIFPFEEAFYKKFNVPVTYVGSPQMESVQCDLSCEEAKKVLGLDAGKKTLVLLPGSRKLEIKRLLPVMLNVAKKLLEFSPEMQFVLPVASTLNIAGIKNYVEASGIKQITVIKGQSYTAIRAADVALCTSGTVTLETALLGTPLVIIYKMHWLSYEIIKRLIKINMIGLCNIVAEKKVAPELIQHEASVKNIVTHIHALLDHEETRRAQLDAFSHLRDKLGTKKASEQVAELAMHLL